MRAISAATRPGLVAVTLACAPLGGVLAQSDDAALRAALSERDAAIRDLEARVRMLEEMVARVAAQAQPPAPSTAPAAAPASAASPAPAPAAPPPPAAASVAAAAAPQRGPGQLDVDLEAAERALERTLVLTGDLLLAPGKLDVEPSLTASYSDQDAIVVRQVQGPSGNQLIADMARTRRNEFGAALDLRLGLPYSTQFEMSLPVDYVNQSVDSALTGADFDDDGFGVGDPVFGFAATLARESGWIPDIVGRVAWDTDFGRDEDGPVSLDSGFNEFRVSLSALRRLDPLALSARVSYETALENDSIDPGDLFAAGFTASLAVSPSTSLSLAFDASHRTETQFSGRSIEGSEQNSAVMSFGVSSVLSRNTLVNLRFGGGLTDDSSDYFAILSLPMRFDAF